MAKTRNGFYLSGQSVHKSAPGNDMYIAISVFVFVAGLFFFLFFGGGGWGGGSLLICSNPLFYISLTRGRDRIHPKPLDALLVLSYVLLNKRS